MHLRKDHDVLLVGHPASGKTTSANAVANKLRDGRRGLVWLNLTDPADGVESLLVTLLTAPARSAYLVVVDNLQANISAGAEVFPAVDWLRERLGLSLNVLATGWESVRRAQLNLPSGLQHIRARGEDVISLLIDQVGGEHRAPILRLARGDLVLAVEALEFHRRHGRVPAYDELVDEVAASVGAAGITDGQTRRWLYWFACLGLFEIDINRERCEQLVPPDALARLLASELVQPNDESLSIGHRSLAALMIRYAAKRPGWIGEELQPPSGIAFDYLQRAEERHVRAVLDNLDLVGIDRESASRSARNLAVQWHWLAVLGNQIRDQTMRDPTWGGDTTAAVNAALTLVTHPNRGSEEFAEAWARIAKFVRDRWQYDEEHGGPRLAEGQYEEPFAGLEEEVVADQAADLEPIRYHRMWVLGLLLEFEARALDHEQWRYPVLVACANREIDARGRFYPRSLPWITAAIVLGLAHGELYVPQAESVVRRARTWLQGWMHGEDTVEGVAAWSAYLPATAICVFALLTAGIQMAEPYIDTATGYLWEKRAEWSRPGREADAALVLEALLRAGQYVDELHPEVYKLLEWVVGDELWEGGAWVGDSPEAQRMRRTLTRVAARLASVVPALVYRRLEQLLHEFDHAPGGPLGQLDDQHAQEAPAAPPALPVANGEPAGSAVRPHRARQAITWISRHIDENIASRQNALSSLHSAEAHEQMRTNLDIWYGHRIECEWIEEQLRQSAPGSGPGSGSVPAEVARRLDELGRATLKHVWVPLAQEG